MSPSAFGPRGSRARLAAAAAFAAVATAAAGVLAGCDQVSEETKDAGATVVCSQIEVEPAEIENNPESARLVALLVRDFAPEENIRTIADQVVEDPNALNPRVQLAEWVDEKCRR